MGTLFVVVSQPGIGLRLNLIGQIDAEVSADDLGDFEL